jgi:hypothetical protein
MNPELEANGPNCRDNVEVPGRLAAERGPSDRGAALGVEIVEFVVP